MSGVVVNILTRLGIIGAVKGNTTAAEATVSAIDDDHNGLDVVVGGALPLPTGAATSAAQATGNNSAATTATNTTTIAGAVSAPDATLPTSAAQIGGVASTAAPSPVTSGRGVRAWFSLIGAQMVGLLGVNGTSIATGANPVPVGGIDGSGTARPLLTSAAGNAQTAPAKGTSYSSAALEISKVVSASACLVSKIRVQNINGATRYVHIFNAAALPGNGTVPTVMFTLTANSGGEVVFPIPTDRFSTGLVVAASSTQGTLTISATADFLIWVDLFPTNA